MNELFRHAKEFAAALRGHRFDVVGDGSLFFPEQKVFASGVYHHRIRGKEDDWQRAPNLLPTEGLNYILDSFVSSHSAIPLYMALYATGIPPAANWTAASFYGTAGEITSNSEGYSEANRVTWTAAAAAAATKDNYSNVAAFTIISSGSLNVNGVGLLTVNTKGSLSGALISATRFGTQRVFANTDVFDVKYQLALTSS